MEKTFGNDKFMRSSDSLKAVKKSESELWAGSWSLLGHLSREKSGFYYPVGHRYVKDLPSDVSRIAVELYKILPSTFVMLFSVLLTEEVGTKINELHRRRYLEQIEFRHFLPIGRWAYGSSQRFGDRVRGREISAYLDAVALRAERQIKKFFPEPRFSKNRRLPILRDMRLVAPVSTDVAFKAGQIFRWGHSLGLHSLSYDSFLNNENTAFIFSENREGDTERLWTLFTSKSGTFTDEENRRIERTSTSFVPMLAIRSLLDSIAKEIGLLRVKAYRRVTRPKRLGGFRHDLQLNARLQVQKFLADRIRTECEGDPHGFARWGAGLSQFKQCISPGSDLYTFLSSGIKAVEERISQHSKLAVGLFQSYVEARNLEVSYRLARRVLIWTIVVTMVGLISCLATYDQSITQAKKIRTSVRAHISKAFHQH